MSKNKDEERRREGREPFKTKIDVFIDTHQLQAESLDMSEYGFRFKNKEPIRCRIRLDFGTEIMEKYVQLVWAQKENDERIYGFEFKPALEDLIY